MLKSPDAFRTISEVADWLGVQTHVLRFWETKFPQVRPVKRAGGRRYYRPADMALLGGIRRLLHDDGLTIRGVQKLMRERGVAHVSALSPPVDGSAAHPLPDAEVSGPHEVAASDTVEPTPADPRDRVESRPPEEEGLDALPVDVAAAGPLSPGPGLYPSARHDGTDDQHDPRDGAPVLRAGIAIAERLRQQPDGLDTAALASIVARLRALRERASRGLE